MIGPNTTITLDQYAKIRWGDSKKATRECCIAVFGRQVLASHSVTGKSSNAFKGKEAKPPLDPVKLSDIIGYINAKTGLTKQEIKKIIAQKCADEEKLAKRKIFTDT
ncbi:hypothetical protein GJAV_G00100000 [Gymnothorax javanicus]|nr:hypothetical protein GJAV_G00100000 [Gymnothorax javanicus]